MNKLIKLMNEKYTENGDKAYKSTGNNLTDLFFMTPYFEKHLDEVSIGTSDKEKLFSMYIRDPRFGLGRRDLGRKLMYLSKVEPVNIVRAGRFDDLWNIPTDENINCLKEMVENNELAKKWMPRLKNKNNVLIGWTDEEFDHRDIYFSLGNTIKYGEIQRGIKANDLFVGIVDWSFYGFKADSTKHPNYIFEKLRLTENNTNKKIAELINGVIAEL